MNKLTSVQQKFILHWGEMGTRWGVNRTVAQVHALLYISPQPLNADDIIDTLDVARSNVSTSLKELQGWGIVKLVHTAWYAQVRRWPTAAMFKFMKTGDKVLKVLGLAS